MPDEDDELNEDLEDEEPSQQLDPNIRKQLRQARKISKERDEMSVRATTAERQLALLKAGIPADGVGELFAKAYDGPLEADAIKEEARKYGLLKEDATDEPASAELAAQQRVAAASAGAPPPGSVPLKEALIGATSQEEVLRIIANAPPEARIRTGESY